MTLDQFIGSAPRQIVRETVTAQVVRVDETGVHVVPVGGDTRVPIGPCRGSQGVVVGESVLLSWTSEGPWIQANIDTSSFETPAGAQAKVNAGVETHRVDTTNVHGITDTSQLETKAGAQTKANLARDAAIAALLGGIPPSALDTILELATAYDDNADAIDAVVLALAGKETPAGAQTKVDAAIDDHEDPDARPHGDSGIRRVVDAGDLTDLPDLILCVRRVGDVVSVWTREPTAAAFSGDVDVYTLPVEFRPDANTIAAQVWDPSANSFVTGAGLVVRHDGTVRLVGATSGARHHAAITGTVDADWPASYPGTVD